MKDFFLDTHVELDETESTPIFLKGKEGSLEGWSNMVFTLQL